MICGVVQSAADSDVAGVEGDDLQALRARRFEAGRVGIDGRVYAGIADLNTQALRCDQRRDDLGHDHVQRRVNAGHDLDRLVVIGEATGQGS
ncbi:hypothetical protein D3C86_1946970 [compost metagenome]